MHGTWTRGHTGTQAELVPPGMSPEAYHDTVCSQWSEPTRAETPQWPSCWAWQRAALSCSVRRPQAPQCWLTSRLLQFRPSFLLMWTPGGGWGWVVRALPPNRSPADSGLAQFGCCGSEGGQQVHCLYYSFKYKAFLSHFPSRDDRCFNPPVLTWCISRPVGAETRRRTSCLLSHSPGGCNS